MRVGPTLVNREPRGTSRVCCLDYIIIRYCYSIFIWETIQKKKKEVDNFDNT